MAGGKFTRIAGFFRTKRQGMLVGSCRGEDLDKLIQVIKDAKAQGKGLTFFLFTNPPKNERSPVAGLTVDVERDKPGYSGGRSGGGFQGRPAQKREDPLAGLDFGGAEPDKSKAELDW